MSSWSAYRQRRILIQLVFGSDAKAGVVAAGGPGQSDGCLQLVVHLLVDGAAELRPVITGRIKDAGLLGYKDPQASRIYE